MKQHGYVDRACEARGQDPGQNQRTGSGLDDRYARCTDGVAPAKSTTAQCTDTYAMRSRWHPDVFVDCFGLRYVDELAPT